MATPLALVWDLVARDNASPAFARVGAAAEGAAVKTEAAATSTVKSSEKMGAAFAAMSKALVAGGGVVAVASIKMASDFEFQMNRMVTAAGESSKNLKLISDGVLNLMVSTGTSAKELEAGLYLIESAGYHGQAGLDVLAVAAKGAKIENADLASVANAVTSAMVDYHLAASDSAAVMNTLIGGVAHGKTTLGDLSEAFSKVGAAGAQANIPMADLTAALATMTMHGTDAASAGTYLRQTIGQLESPTAKARAVMAGLGIDANKLSLTLSSGPGGLASAIGLLDSAITQHMTPSGLVAIEMFKKSSGSLSDFEKVLGDIPPSMVSSFSALANMTGGVKSLQGILQLGGENLKTFRDNTLAINEGVKAGGKDVEGWASTQKQLSVVFDQLRGQMDKWLIQLGEKLIPLVISAIGWVRENSRAFGEIGHVISTVVRAAFDDLTVVVRGGIALFQEHRQIITEVAKAIAGTLVAALIGLQVTFQTTSRWIGDHKTLVESLGAAVLAGAAAFTVWKIAIAAWTVVTKVAAAVQLAFNAVMNANPVLLVVTAVAALAAGLIYAYKHSDSFRHIVDEVGRALRTAFLTSLNAVRDAIDFVVDHWKIFAAVLAVALAPLTIMVAAIAGVILAIKHWGDILDVFQHAFTNVTHAISVAWRDTMGVLKSAWDAVYPTIKVIGEIWYAVIGGTVLLAIYVFKKEWQILWGAVTTAWRDVGRPVFNEISGQVGFWWKNVIKPVFDLVVTAWTLLWDSVKIEWAAGKAVFEAVAAAAVWLWKGGIKPQIDSIVGAWHDLWSLAGAAWRDVGKPMFDGIATAVTWLWKGGIKPQLDAIRDAWSALWSGMGRAFSDIWGGVKAAVVEQVNGIIDVLNGFVKAINWILNKLPGGFKIDLIPQVGAGQSAESTQRDYFGFAGGGVVPGYAPGVDSVRAMLSPGEGVLVPEATRAFGGAAGIGAINGMFTNRSSTPGHFAGGGVAGWLGGVAGAVGAGIKDAVDATLGSALSAAESPVWAVINALPAGILRDLAKGLFGKVDGGIRSALYDSGGVLPPGATLAINNTGKNERVFTSGQLGQMGARNITVNQVINTPIYEPASRLGPEALKLAAVGLDR